MNVVWILLLNVMNKKINNFILLKKKERTEQSSRKNITKQQRDSQPIRCTVQNTANKDAHRIGWIWSQMR